MKTISLTHLSLVLLMLVAFGCSGPAPRETAQESTKIASTETSDTNVASVQYLANTGLLVQNGPNKVLFDPLFNKSFNNYQLVTDKDRHLLMSGITPFDGVDAVFISHAHGDHFDGIDMNAYLHAQPEVILIAPPQAVKSMKQSQGWSDRFMDRIKSAELELGQAPMKFEIGNITASAIRVPHAGWPNRMLDVENMIYRVDVGNGGIVMHMGDADPNHAHFNPHHDHWQTVKTHTAFPPYWFFGSRDGDAIIHDTLNVQHAIGVHVPIKVPEELKATGEKYFSKPGQQHLLDNH